MMVLFFYVIEKSYEDLEDRKKIIVNAEKIAENLKEADNALGNNAIDAISIAIRALEKIEEINNQIKQKLEELKKYKPKKSTKDLVQESQNAIEELRKKKNRILNLHCRIFYWLFSYCA